MALVSVEWLKQHARVDGDHELLLMQLYGDAAEQAVLGHIQRPVYPEDAILPLEDEVGYDAYQMHVNDAIRVAVMIVAAHLYEDRLGSTAGDAVLPAQARMLLAPWRVWRPEVVDDGEAAVSL